MNKGISTGTVERISDDCIYYNVNLYNPGPQSIPATYLDPRTLPILDGKNQIPNDYHFSCISFNLPTTEIPIFNFKDGSYKVTLTYLGVDYTTTVLYIQTDFTNSASREVFNIYDFITMINAALTTSYNALHAATGHGTAAPFLAFDPPTSLFSLYANADYLDSAVNPINIFFNTSLANFFVTFSYFFFGTTLTKSFQISVRNLGTNFNAVTGLYQMEETSSSVSAWTDLTKIVFTSTLIPVRQETLPLAQGTTSANSRPILMSFNPGLEGTALNPNSAFSFVYVPSAEFIRADLRSSDPLLNVDIQCFWQSKDQTLNQVLIPQNSALTMRFLFEKKKNRY
jgi:hypothetical protein